MISQASPLRESKGLKCIYASFWRERLTGVRMTKWRKVKICHDSICESTFLDVPKSYSSIP